MLEDIVEGQGDGSGNSHDEDSEVEELVVSQDETVNRDSESQSENSEIQSESSSDTGSVYEDAPHMFHSAQLDDSLDMYDDVDQPPRRSSRNKLPAKKLVYDELGQPDWKSLRLGGHSKKVKKKRK